MPQTAVRTDDGPQIRPVPVGRRGQLAALHAQLVWCEEAVRKARQQTDTAMRNGEVEEGERWAAVRRLRGLAWKVCREVLPLVGRVPASLQRDPAYVECQRAAHSLRRETEAALRDNDNHTVSLVVIADEASQVLGRRTSVR
jgi:hypothetical protein